MRRMRALALAALACAALALLPAATAASSPHASALVPVQEVYADRLVAATHYTVTGYIAMEHFAPLKATDVRARAFLTLPFADRCLRCAARASPALTRSRDAWPRVWLCSVCVRRR